MKNIIYILCIMFLFCGCFEGPTGSAGYPGEQGEKGEQGPAGDDFNIEIMTGILYVSDRIDGEEFINYWDINIPSSEERMIEVFVRKGSGYMWKEPLWLFCKWHVRIADNSQVNPGDEYIILLAE